MENEYLSILLIETLFYIPIYYKVKTINIFFTLMGCCYDSAGKLSQYNTYNGEIIEK